jgi:glycosyltransferase involved in cell wall biosynthesis
MKGVVMLVNEFPPLPVGGAERQAERLSAHLSRHGWMVWVLTRRAPGLSHIESRLGFQIVRPPVFGSGKMKTVFFLVGVLKELWRLRSKYSILHAHLAFGPAFVAVIAARLLGKHVVVKLGNSGEFGDIHVSQKTWRGRLRLAVLRCWADIVIVLDDVMQAEALSAGFSPARVRRMVNGIDAQAFVYSTSRAEAQAALGLSGKVVVLSMGRLSQQKSIPDLLRAFALALPACQALHLLVLGDGPEQSVLDKLTRSLKITENVTFTGNKTNVLPYLGAADLFVLPSASEGISNALLESMSAGLACLATPVGGNPEVLDHGRCGLLLPVGDVAAWSSALVRLGSSAQLRHELGAAAQERVRKEYGLEQVGARYEALYAELLGTPKSSMSEFADVKQ